MPPVTSDTTGSPQSYPSGVPQAGSIPPGLYQTNPTQGQAPVQAVQLGQQTPQLPGMPLPPGGQAAGGPVPATGNPAIADDTDLIEKEWVVKAKQIVERTKSDPYMQSVELNKIKAEYIKKRYNKEIKLPES